MADFFFSASFCSEYMTLLRLWTMFFRITDYFCAADRMFSRPFAQNCAYLLTSQSTQKRLNKRCKKTPLI